MKKEFEADVKLKALFLHNTHHENIHNTTYTFVNPAQRKHRYGHTSLHYNLYRAPPK